MGVAYNPKTVTDGLVMALDAANPKSFSPNVFAKPLDIYTWYVTQKGDSLANACTISQDNATSKSPVNGIPLRMDVTGTDAHIGSINTSVWNICPVSNGQTWRVSVYAKASTTLNDCEIYIFGADSTGTAFVGGSWIGITQKTITITTEWQRFDHFITFNNASVAYIQMRLDGPNSGGTGTTVWWDGLQVELAPAVTAFNPRTNTNRASCIDVSGNNVTSTLINYPAFIATNNGYFVFDGTDKYVAGNLSSPAVGSSTTIEAVINLSSVSGTKAIFSHGGSGVSFACGMMIVGNNLRFRNSNNDHVLSAPTTLAAGQWYHLVLASTASQTIGYCNGISQGTTAQTITSNSITDYHIGRRSNNSASEFMAGNIAYLRVYHNKALSQEEVLQNFNASRSRYGI